jgi:glutathionyl-hydroquinone reductase
MAAYVAEAGEFTRDTKYIETRITADGRDGYPVQPDRYRLIVARACPWANRAIIVRRLLGLESVLSIGFCGPTHDKRSCGCRRSAGSLPLGARSLERQGDLSQPEVVG